MQAPRTAASIEPGDTSVVFVVTFFLPAPSVRFLRLDVVPLLPMLGAGRVAAVAGLRVERVAGHFAAVLAVHALRSVLVTRHAGERLAVGRRMA